MEAKVSLVITYYNKVNAAAKMLTSISNQIWRNIELILVDDGSTDGTINVLKFWETKLVNLGYEVKIICQKNAGVSAAAKTGMENITGEYMCLLDGDDELDPEYISTMANWLSQHPDYDFCRCNYYRKQFINGQVVLTEGLLPYNEKEIESYDTQKRTLCYILKKIIPSIWMYMVRTVYLNRCGLPENYHIGIRTNQECNFIVPLLVGGGKMKFLPFFLYIYNCTGEGASIERRYSGENWDYIEMKERNWHELLKITIRSLDIEPKFMQQALFLADLCFFFSMCDHAYKLRPSSEFGYIMSAISLINKYFFISLDADNFKNSIQLLKEFVSAIMLKLQFADVSEHKGKRIAYGVLGERGKKYLHLLSDTPFAPDQLWDLNGDNLEVKKPDFSLLNSDDLLIVFPNNLKLDIICDQISFADLYLYILNKKIQIANG